MTHPSADRVVFGVVAAWFAALTLTGFARSFFFRSLPEPLPTHLVVHGVVYSAWVLLYLVQTALVSARRVRWHMALGSSGVLVLLAMIPVGFHVVLVKTAADHKTVDEAGFNLTTLTVGFALAFAGLAQRRRPFVHKRLMAFATLMLTVAAADRVAMAVELEELRWFRKLLALAPGLALVAYDAWSRRRLPFLSLGLFAVAWLVLWVVVSDALFQRPAGEAVVRALARVFVW